MKLTVLLDQARQFPLFGVEDCQKWFPNTSRNVILLQLTQYVKRDYFLRLRRGLYLLNGAPRPHPLAVASRLRSDAVISLESVLSEHGLTPETAFSVTALTGGRNARFSFPEIGTFIFRHLEPRLLFGWNLRQLPPYAARVATMEKALLDLLWFHRLEPDAPGYLRELRIDIPANFSWPDFSALARQFNNKRLRELARLTEQIYHH